jgi:hypothetical protein
MKFRESGILLILLLLLLLLLVVVLVVVVVVVVVVVILRVQFPLVSLEFFIDIIFPAELWSWG